MTLGDSLECLALCQELRTGPKKTYPRCSTPFDKIEPTFKRMNLHTTASRLLLRARAVYAKRAMSTLMELKPEVVLSQKNRQSCAAKLKLYKTPKKGNDNANQAAVLVPLCMYNGELGFLYTMRSSKLNSNRGQVSFPGGMRDKEDKNLEETALRETWEELNIPKEKVEIWTSGNLIGRKNINVMPVLGYIGEVDPTKLQVNPQEVEEAFVLSLKNLCDPAFCRYTQFRGNYTLPVYLGEKHRIWGLTAAITHMVLNSLVPGAYRHKLVYIQPIEQIYNQRKTSTVAS